MGAELDAAGGETAVSAFTGATTTAAESEKAISFWAIACICNLGRVKSTITNLVSTQKPSALSDRGQTLPYAVPIVALRYLSRTFREDLGHRKIFTWMGIWSCVSGSFSEVNSWIECE